MLPETSKPGNHPRQQGHRLGTNIFIRNAAGGKIFLEENGDVNEQTRFQQATRIQQLRFNKQNAGFNNQRDGFNNHGVVNLGMGFLGFGMTSLTKVWCLGMWCLVGLFVWWFKLFPILFQKRDGNQVYFACESKHQHGVFDMTDGNQVNFIVKSWHLEIQHLEIIHGLKIFMLRKTAKKKM